MGYKSASEIKRRRILVTSVYDDCDKETSERCRQNAQMDMSEITNFQAVTKWAIYGMHF